MEYHICVSRCTNHLKGWSFCGCSSADTSLVNNVVDIGIVYFRASLTDVTLQPVNGTVASMRCTWAQKDMYH